MLLRIILAQPEPLQEWPLIDRALASELLRVECLRSIDAASLSGRVPSEQLADGRSAILSAIASLELIPLDGRVLRRAAEPFPTLVGTLDAIHLATALRAHDVVPELVFATHDRQLATAATAMGLDVVGV